MSTGFIPALSRLRGPASSRALPGRAAAQSSSLIRYHDATLNDAHTQQIQSTLLAHGGFELAFVFGSVAQGTARADSDLDIAVMGAQVLTAAQKMALIADLAQATGRAVDLIDLRTVGEPLLGQILRHGQRLFGSNDAYGQLLSRHLIDSADFLPYAQRIIDERRRAWIGP